jgi:glycosyltransferase involved in cell wall biosynthesis
LDAPIQSDDKHIGITAILIVYNEEKIIERCLKSLEGVVDEIIVIHDGECKDNTLSIAGRFTDKIFIEPHKGEAELHQIKGLEHASYSWILKIDADEFLSEELRTNLRVLISDENADAYAFIWPIWDGKAYITREVPYKPALFRRMKINAVEFPHKTFSTNGKKKDVPLLLEHQPEYNNFTWTTFKNKWIKWIKIQAIATCYYKQAQFYNYSEEQIKVFYKYMENQIRFANPFCIPVWFCLSFTKFFFRLRIWGNIKIMKIAILQGLYGSWLCYYIWKEKKQKMVGK